MTRFLTFVVVLALFAPMSARAQEAAVQDPQAEATRLLEEARELYANSGDVRRALALFRRSYELVPSWKAASGVAFMLDEQGEYLEAIAAYELLRDRFAAELSPEQRARIDGRIARLHAQTGLVSLVVEQAGVLVVLDGEVLGHGPFERTIRVMPGKHVLVATLDGHVPRSLTVELRPGDTSKQVLRLEPVRVRVEVEEKQETRRWPQWLPWTTLGAGVALGTAGVLLLVDAGEDIDAIDDDVRDGWGSGQAAQPLGDDPRFDDAETKQALGVSFLVVGGAALATGVVLVVLNQPRTVVTRRLPGVALGPRGVLFAFEF